MGETSDPMNRADRRRESTSGTGSPDTADDAFAFDVAEIVPIDDDDDDMDTAGDGAGDNTTDAIRSDIEQTRAQMSSTIDEIQERLSPRRLMDEAKETVREATVGKVTGMMNNAGRSASGVVDRIKENPVTAAIIGAGAWWLLTRLPEGARSSSSYARTYGNLSSGSNRYEEGGDAWSSSARTGESGGIREMARSASETVSDYTTLGREQFSDMTDSATRGLNRWVRENPLAVGAAAVAVGAIIGAAIPETERERELVGETRDRLIGKAQQMASQTVEQVASAIPGASGGSASEHSGSSRGNSGSGSGSATPGKP